MQLVLASNNAKKLAELGALLAPLGVHIVAQGALGIDEAEEPFGTFVENALTKARHAARQAGGPAIADDSGLCVDALAGAPGVVSAHYAAIDTPVAASAQAISSDAAPPTPVKAPGIPSLIPPYLDREARRRLQDAANNRLLLERLSGVTDRRARFVCTLVALRSATDPEPLVAVGRWEGAILEAPSGGGGFGYDPLLFIPSLGASVAMLDAEVKNVFSHRAIAVRQLLVAMREVWSLG